MFRPIASTSMRVSHPINIARTLATHASPSSTSVIRHNWTKPEIRGIYDSPLMDLVYRAASVHRQHHDPSKIQLCTLMNIKSMNTYTRLLRRWLLTHVALSGRLHGRLWVIFAFRRKSEVLTSFFRFLLLPIISLFHAHQGVASC